MYGGGRRRKRRKGSDGDLSGWLAFFALVMMALAAFAVFWSLTLFGHAIGMTPSWHDLMHRNHVWEHQHYPLVGLRYVGAVAILLGVLVAVVVPIRLSARKRAAGQNRLAAEQAAAQERLAARQAAWEEQRARDMHEAWLAGPSPALHLPGRFTQNWIVQNAPGLHPGQTLVLMDELLRRGWTDSDIERRVSPYLPAREPSQWHRIASLDRDRPEQVRIAAEADRAKRSGC